MTPPLRILLADDHETVREGLKAILNAQPDMTVVAEVTDGTEALEQARVVKPDIILMDVSMPRMNGLKATSALKEQLPGIKLVALTRHSGDGYVQQMLRAGVEGYVLKQSRTSELLHAIRAVAAGGKYLDSAIAARVIAESPHHRMPLRSDGIGLTSREEEVLRLIAWGHSNKEIASRLDLSVKTVETHKANATHKLGLHSRIDIVRFAVLRGWLQDDA